MAHKAKSFCRNCGALCPMELTVKEERFGYRLTCRRILDAMNGAYLDSRRSRKRHPVNWAHMNPQDMEAAGITEGGVVEIESEAGRIRGVAKAEDGLRRGVVSMTHFFGAIEPSTDPWKQRGSYTGRLTSIDRHLEPINFMPRFSGVPVNVRPVLGAQVVISDIDAARSEDVAAKFARGMKWVCSPRPRRMVPFANAPKARISQPFDVR